MRLVTLAVLLIVACRDSLPTMPTGAFSVSGRVLDFSSGAPVPGVAIQFGDQQLTTDATGGYAVTTIVGMHTVKAADASVSIWVHGPSTRGDVFINAGPNCAARYGQVFDSQSGWAIENATVDGVRAGPDGWYRREGGCSGCGACNTRFLSISAPGYVSKSSLVGRGLSGVVRFDVPLDRGRDPS